MQALIFAAGLGTRMRPLTDHTPKPLLKVADKPLIVYHLEALQAIGVQHVVINTAYLAAKFPALLGNGSHWGLTLEYIDEGQQPLETGGGMLNALQYLDDAPFLAVNGDIYSDFAYQCLPQHISTLAHLVLVENPPHHPDGDFCLLADGTLGLPQTGKHQTLTFAGIGIYRQPLFAHWQNIITHTKIAANGKPIFKLAPLLRQHIKQQSISGQWHRGLWTDVGTPERLAKLDASLSQPPET